MAQRTLTNRSDRPRRRTLTGPCLVRLFEYERPLAPGARHELDDLAEVALGRGDGARTVRERSKLTLECPDARMSTRHARLVCDAGGWAIEDHNSRNGTHVDGKRVERATLHDGAVIELGRTAWLFTIDDRADRSDLDEEDLPHVLGGLTTFSFALARRLADAARIARSAQPLVIHGETGTGKEVVARAIHLESGRSGEFVAINCAALPANLIESELFGFKKGAFSGATDDRVGLVRAADGGTLLLDEIGDLPAQVQLALLRVLQQREVLPVGATKPIAVDLRVIAASHRDLEAAVEAGTFREDLLARLAGFVLELPPLRARRVDLGIVTRALLTNIAGGERIRLAPEAGFALLRYGWPRNVRELEQALTTAVALAADGVIERDHLPPAVGRGAIGPSTSDAVGDDFSPSERKQRDELRTLLASHRGNLAAVARAMGVARMQIHRWLEKYGLDAADFRP